MQTPPGLLQIYLLKKSEMLISVCCKTALMLTLVDPLSTYELESEMILTPFISIAIAQK